MSSNNTGKPNRESVGYLCFGMGIALLIMPLGLLSNVGGVILMVLGVWLIFHDQLATRRLK